MTGMFSNSNFNQDISGWDTSSVTDMYSMFFGTLFNQDISSWNTSSLNITQFMFANTDYFNQDISSWDVSGVTDMTGMFYDATAFNQDISSWDIRNVVSFGSFLTFSNISTKNYDKLLMNWARLIPLQNSIYLGVANIDYTVGNPENARQYIIDNYGWTFFDGGKISDILSPEVSILNPQNNSYYENSILTLNLSVYDPNLDEVIYNFNGTNITYSSPINISFNVGENTLEVWAIDDYENLNYSYFIFYISQDENEENIEEDISIESSGPLIYYPTENNLKEGYSRIYYVNANSNLIINNENHKLNVDKINKNTVVVTISSNPQTKELSIGEEWKVDLNDDDVFDLLVKINSISGSRTNIMIKKIEEKIIKTNVENDVVNIEEEIIDENYEVEYPDVVENKGNSSYFIISTLILILLVILYFILTKKKVQKNNSFKKKSNKKSQKKSVNRKKNK